MITHAWLQRRIDVDEAVFGPVTTLLLTAGQRRELIQLFTEEMRHASSARFRGLCYTGLPVAVPRRDAYMGGVRA